MSSAPSVAAPKPIVSVVMGSVSDWDTMRHAAQILADFQIPYEAEVVSAHRTPDKLFQHAETAQARGFRVIIAGAGGAAHLPGMIAAKTAIPVLGVPILSQALSGLDSLYSIVQMPQGIPVATFAIGKAGAVNAALFCAALLAHDMPNICQRLADFRQRQTQSIEQKSHLPPLNYAP